MKKHVFLMEEFLIVKLKTPFLGTVPPPSYLSSKTLLVEVLIYNDVFKDKYYDMIKYSWHVSYK